MTRFSQVIDVLISSPSDCAQERNVLTEVIDDWNSAHSRATGITLSAVRWETDSHPAAGAHPQELLNKQLVEDADMLIGVFWHRMGTPTKVAPSGTAEEIQILVGKGKPVMLYFSQAPVPYRHDPMQLDAVKQFQESITSNALYGTFSSYGELRRMASTHLAKVVNEIMPGLKSRSADGAGRTHSSETQDLAQSKSPAKANKILEYKGKAVTVHNVRQTPMGPDVSVWPEGYTIRDCDDWWVTLFHSGQQDTQSISLEQVNLSFDDKNHRLKLEIQR